MLKKYYENEIEFREFWEKIKCELCPHCEMAGTLILHGYLYGFGLKDLNKIIKKGHRIFCSNRNSKQGCGKTFSMINANFLKGFMITTLSLWEILNKLTKMCPLKALKNLSFKLSITSIYRLRNTLLQAQSRIRTILSRYCKVPNKDSTITPLDQTALHLQQAFKSSKNPIKNFQHIFQKAFI